jgi:hypothetical protein
MKRAPGFFADTNGYAKLIRNVLWAPREVEATLAVPQLEPRVNDNFHEPSRNPHCSLHR